MPFELLSFAATASGAVMQVVHVYDAGAGDELDFLLQPVNTLAQMAALKMVSDKTDFFIIGTIELVKIFGCCKRRHRGNVPQYHFRGILRRERNVATGRNTVSYSSQPEDSLTYRPS